MNRRQKEAFHLGENPNGQQIYEKVLDVINHQGDVNQSHNEIGQN